VVDGNITNRELFNKLMETMDKLTLIQEKTAENMGKIREEVHGYNTENSKLRKLVEGKIWWVVGACLVIAAGAIGIKLMWP
jgi:hypothetical protein